MRANKIVLAISGVAALCLVGAVFLSAREVGAEPADDTVGSQPARGLSGSTARYPGPGGDAAGSSAMTSPSGASSNRGAFVL